MLLRIPELLSADDLATIDAALAQATFVDGATTAGRGARDVKNNLQAESGSLPDLEGLVQIVVGALARHPTVRSAAMPKRILPPLFNKYETGMGYGAHSDNPIMGRRTMVRTDVSVTVFLSDPDTYDGGELRVMAAGGPVNIKLPRGDAVLYPSTGTHLVQEVTSGQRLAAVTWIQSIVGDGNKRQILHDLDLAYKLVQREVPESPQAGLLLRTYSDLVRMWAEV